jgi:hypothetical protein
MELYLHFVRLHVVVISESQEQFYPLPLILPITLEHGHTISCSEVVTLPIFLFVR